MQSTITITLTCSRANRKAEVTLPASTTVAALMWECQRRWSLEGNIRFILSERGYVSDRRTVYITQYQQQQSVAQAGIKSGAIIDVLNDEELVTAPGGFESSAVAFEWLESRLYNPLRILIPSRKQAILAAVAGFALLGGYVHVMRVPVPLDQALTQGLVRVEATGAGGTSSVMLNVSAASNRVIGLRIAVPSGARFSGTGKHQAMAVSHTTVIDVPAAAGTMVRTEIPAYCLNRFLPPPSLEASLKLEEGSGSEPEEREPIQKLIKCLEKGSADRKVGQMAVWVVTEGLLDKSRSQVLELFRARAEKELVAEVETKLASAENFQALKTQFPDIPEERIRERIAQTKRDVAQAEVAKVIEREIDDYVRSAYHPLRDCGYDTSTARFFQR
jgi:hypothetical protein